MDHESLLQLLDRINSTQVKMAAVFDLLVMQGDRHGVRRSRHPFPRRVSDCLQHEAFEGGSLTAQTRSLLSQPTALIRAHSRSSLWPQCVR
jgi:hypothetical protein